MVGVWLDRFRDDLLVDFTGVGRISRFSMGAGMFVLFIPIVYAYISLTCV